MFNRITYPQQNFNGTTVKVWKWINNFIPHFTIDDISSIMGFKLIHVSKRSQRRCDKNHCVTLTKYEMVRSEFVNMTVAEALLPIHGHTALTRVSRHVLIKKYFIRFFTLFRWFVWLMSVHCRINAFESLNLWIMRHQSIPGNIIADFMVSIIQGLKIRVVITLLMLK